MAQWQTANLQGIEAVATAAATVSTVTGIATTYTAGMAGAVAGIVGLIPSAAAIVEATAALALSTALDVALSPLDLGCYMCLAYPRDLDFNYANLLTDYIDGIKQLQQRFGLSREEVLRVFGQRIEGAGPPTSGDVDVFVRLLQSLPAFPSSPFQNAAVTSQDQINSAFDTLVQDLQEKKRKLYFSRWPRRTIYSFSDWVNQVEDSMYDEGDPRRPQFTLSSITSGGALIIGADNVNEFVTRLQRLAALVGNKKMARFAAAGANALGARTPATSRRGYNKFPDWSSVSVGDVVGLTDVKGKARRAVNSVLGLNSLASAQVAAYVSRVVGNVQTIISGIDDVAALINAAAAADIGASVLFIPPEDGQDTVAIAGQTYTVPKGTYGNEGFIYALRNATNAPTWNYVAGFVFMVGAPIPGFEAALQALNVTSGTAPAGAVARYLSQSGADVPISQFVSAINGAQQVHSQTMSAFRRLLT